MAQITVPIIVDFETEPNRGTTDRRTIYSTAMFLHTGNQYRGLQEQIWHATRDIFPMQHGSLPHDITGEYRLHQSIFKKFKIHATSLGNERIEVTQDNMNALFSIFHCAIEAGREHVLSVTFYPEHGDGTTKRVHPADDGGDGDKNQSKLQPPSSQSKWADPDIDAAERSKRKGKKGKGRNDNAAEDDTEEDDAGEEDSPESASDESRESSLKMLAGWQLWGEDQWMANHAAVIYPPGWRARVKERL